MNSILIIGYLRWKPEAAIRLGLLGQGALHSLSFCVVVPILHVG